MPQSPTHGHDDLVDMDMLQRLCGDVVRAPLQLLQQIHDGLHNVTAERLERDVEVARAVRRCQELLLNVKFEEEMRNQHEGKPWRTHSRPRSSGSRICWVSSGRCTHVLCIGLADKAEDSAGHVSNNEF